MNLVLLRKELREARWKLVVGSGILAVIAVVVPLTFEMIKDFLLLVPGEQLERFGGMMVPGIFTDYSLYIWSQWNAKNLLQIGTIISIMIGMNLIAGEVNGQTAAFLLSRPISRRCVFLTKSAAGALIILIIVSLSTLILAAAVMFTPYSLDTGRIVVATLITTLGFFAILSIAIFFSTLIDEPVKSGGITALGALLLYILGWFPPTRNLSLFMHMTGAQYFVGNTFPLWPVMGMLLLSTVFLAAGMVVFERKEI